MRGPLIESRMAEGLLYFHKTLGEKFLLIYGKLNKGNLVYSFPTPFPPVAQQTLVGQGLLIDASR